MSGPDDEERAVLARMAALDAEVRAAGDVERRRKAAIAEIVRRKQAAAEAPGLAKASTVERAQPAVAAPARPLDEPRAMVTRPSEAVKPVPRPAPVAVASKPDDDAADGLTFARQMELASGAMKLAGKADKVRQELTARPTSATQKSLMTAGLASTFLGPLGWFYAGSVREATVGSAAWLIGGTLVSRILPTFMLMPLLIPLLLLFPLSGIIGMMYASRYNREGKRQRMFGPTKDESKTGKLTGSDPRKQLDAGGTSKRR